jgi:hypothetical protein
LSFDFGGTFNNHGVSRLVSFSQNQFVDAAGRVIHLSAEIARIGTLLFSYDGGGNPISYTASPNSSYIGKLIMVYEILGGDPLFDLQVRSQAQAVYLVASSDHTTPAQQMSSGDIVGQPGLNDALSCSLVQQMKSWTEEVIQYKRENIERKVRRAVDYVDQLTAEKNLILAATSGASTTGSVANLTTQIATLLADPTYRATYNDTNNDYHQKLTKSPKGAFNPGANRTVAPGTVIVDGGVLISGQQTSPSGTGTPPTPTLPGQIPTIPE